MKYPGSKKSMARWIISHFPAGYEGMTYLEPFFGSGCVFFAKERSQIETLNDRDEEIFNLFEQIRDNTEQLIFAVENTPWGRIDYLQAFEKSNNSLEKARRFLVRTWFSIGSGYRVPYGQRMLIKRASGGHDSFHQKLPEVLTKAGRRLRCQAGQYVQIENKDAMELIKKYNRPNVLMYLDPPYVAGTRKHKRIYNYEMDNTEHRRLLEIICNIDAKVLISGYDSDLYNEYLYTWNKDTVISNGEAGNKRSECIWFNYNTRQFDLFAKGHEYVC
jgi:DNA adenine methylase